MSASMSGTGDATDETSTTPHNRRSKVWEHFEENLDIVGDVPKAVCKYCKMKFTYTKKSGTSSLLGHISEYCRLIGAEDRARFKTTLKKKATDVGFVFDLRRSRKLMTKFCIHAEVPFRKFEDPYFEEWMESMQPTFKVIGRQTVRNDCILEHDEMKDKLKLELETLDSRICLTSDMWTSVQKLGYMCVTAHYIDANFVLKKKIISFKDVKYPHTKDAIEEALRICLSDWGIKHKLLTLTLDNAANNTTTVNNFLGSKDHGLLLDGVDFHVRCSAHILNILVTDGTFYSQPKSEVDAYLEDHFMEDPDETFDILAWWRSNAEKYPVLSAMARDFLAVPLSTVSSESAFSCGGRVLGESRASLKPHALEALVCGKDWLRKTPGNEGPSLVGGPSSTGGPSSEHDG